MAVGLRPRPRQHPATWRDTGAAIRAALTVPDPQRVSSPVRVYGPDGTLRETVTPHEWATRYPRRFMRPSSPGRRRISW